ncbi:MAG: hypothetical protein IPI16_06795 [Comamonadaceae bacterium]|jgi:hypothetical protein|uniref:hypothetical protein n=1 Tax=Candidatus Skiveiella danica TaxID=3386177 RepID=UPI00390B2821|nr:hypothetical protein [Comamonadaceae bacterium]MBK7507876.1 hypothetical protein [Comamonadaceae bacterium]
MLRKFFKRSRETVAAPEPQPPAQIPLAPKGSPLDAFREGWDERWETPGPLPSPEVIEGDGGHTDWDTWTEAVEVEKNAFAETVPYEESSSKSSASDLENAYAPTVPALLGPE